MQRRRHKRHMIPEFRRSDLNPSLCALLPNLITAIQDTGFDKTNERVLLYRASLLRSIMVVPPHALPLLLVVMGDDITCRPYSAMAVKSCLS